MKNLLLITGLLLLLPGMVLAQNGEDDAENEDKFEELTKDAEHLEGFFDLYKTEENLYMAVSKEDLDKEFLMNFEIAQGIGSSGLYGGTMLNIFEGLLVRLEKREGRRGYSGGKSCGADLWKLRLGNRRN